MESRSRTLRDRIRATGAVAFAYVLLLHFALAPVAMMKAHAATGDLQGIVLCIDGHGASSQAGGPHHREHHDCSDCCLNRVATVATPAPAPSQPVLVGQAPVSDGTAWEATDVRGPPREAWSDHKTQRGPPARA